MKLEQLRINDASKTEVTPKLSQESIDDLANNSIPVSKIDIGDFVGSEDNYIVVNDNSGDYYFGVSIDNKKILKSGEYPEYDELATSGYVIDEIKKEISKIDLTAVDTNTISKFGLIPLSKNFKTIRQNSSKRNITAILNTNISGAYILVFGTSIWSNDGKKITINIDGSSYSQNIYGYQTLILDNYYVRIMNDFIESGYSLGGQTNSDGASLAIRAIKKNMSTSVLEFDMIIIDTVTNDFKRNIPIGSFSNFISAFEIGLNSIDIGATPITGDLATTFYGALGVIIGCYIRKKGPLSIILCAGSHRDNSGYNSIDFENSVGHFMTDYNKALINVVNFLTTSINNKYFQEYDKKLTIVYCDYYNKGYSYNDLKVATYDGLHLINYGYQYNFINVLKPCLEYINDFVTIDKPEHDSSIFRVPTGFGIDRIDLVKIKEEVKEDISIPLIKNKYYNKVSNEILDVSGYWAYSDYVEINNYKKVTCKYTLPVIDSTAPIITFSSSKKKLRELPVNLIQDRELHEITITFNQGEHYFIWNTFFVSNENYEQYTCILKDK